LRWCSCPEVGGEGPYLDYDAVLNQPIEHVCPAGSQRVSFDERRPHIQCDPLVREVAVPARQRRVSWYLVSNRSRTSQEIYVGFYPIPAAQPTGGTERPSITWVRGQDARWDNEFRENAVSHSALQPNPSALSHQQ